MIWRIRDRRTFDQLRHRGLRTRQGPVTVVYVDAPGPAVPRVAYAVGRRVGGAVVRNRIRRRLRAAMADLARTSPDLVPAGAYLVSAGPDAAALPFGQLAAALEGAVRRLGTRLEPAPRPDPGPGPR